LKGALKPRYRSNFAGAIAAQKVIAYVSELNAANDRRIELGQEIIRINKEADNLERAEPEKATSYRVTIGRLASMQEVAIHRFASAIERISVFLPAATKTSGYELSTTGGVRIGWPTSSQGQTDASFQAAD
jgi:hypothetical protein